jgi:hypothetical protein
MPFNVTVRSRGTGRLIGRLDLPDLSLFREHPLLESGPEELPIAHDGDRLVVTDGWYVIAVDTARIRVAWKWLIDQNDLTREPPMRFALGGDSLAVLKQNYDVKVIYMLSSRTGKVLWRTDPKDADSPRPMYDTVLAGHRAIGLAPHPGRGFYFVAYDRKTGRRLFRTAEADYDSRPKARLLPTLFSRFVALPDLFGRYAVVTVQDRQRFELKVFDIRDGKRVHVVRKKGVGPFGVHGRVSATVQSGRLVLLSKHKLSF